MRLKCFRFSVILVFLGFFLNFLFVSVSFSQDAPLPRKERLKRQIEAVFEDVQGKVGVAVKHLETGEELSVNGNDSFPMASVFKIPVFVEVMAQVKNGNFSLSDYVSLQKSHQHLGSGILSDLDVPGIKLSIQNLVNLMMMISDNSATDILLTKVGPSNVNQRLRNYDIQGIMVNRTCQELIMDYLGMDYEKHKGLSLKEVEEAYEEFREENPEVFRKASQKFSEIPKDQATPLAMNRLLELIFKKDILDEKSCETILSVMKKCQTGRGRIKGNLPQGTPVAHKTGTIGGTVNNVGIIYLPYNQGHVALSVFTKNMDRESQDVEEIIAQIARFVYDYFSLAPLILQ